MNRYEAKVVINMSKWMYPVLKRVGAEIWDAIQDGTLSFQLDNGKIIISSKRFVKGNVEINLSDLISAFTSSFHKCPIGE